MYLSKMLRKVPVKLLTKSFFPRQECLRSYSVPKTLYTSKLSFINDSNPAVIPTYRVMNNDELSAQDLKISDDALVKAYKTMLQLNTMDTILYESQRQGRISFYMTNFGEEAVQIGSAAALLADDLIYAQYREAGILLWRDFRVSDFVNQCYGNVEDINKGRQMPVHYGSKALNFMTISSPLTTQLPQAAGAAYAFKLSGKKACVACYFGEGAASEGDAHAALNFAATLSCPVVFVCRNNGYAISTPSHQQYNGDGIAAKGPAYGISTIRVDGNDLIAVFNATRYARDYAVEKKKPVLIEAMTYRVGHHSTSDDSTAYRSNSEINSRANASPIRRLRSYLESRKLWDQAREDEAIKANKKSVIDAIAAAETKLKPGWKDMFADVYCEMPEHMKKQMIVMEKHVEKYGDRYPMSKYSRE
ncbi:2-oxoisovalerate dehydrogenase subunit alpha, mitochondrial-like [Nasonia vitripennis]|uniref:2-oxoisovalerate dehydrogenase subunit alpha n=1 Tax=Nasonia vitripennis TaxID=7425 RepID=A0A7M7GC34_NASVI|nr:2-oxoisovalerate dehydrogenase subunit alpha, mitochondrial-like [Nasonia vitripennis]